jgi:nitrate reductase gamma subunit
MWLFELAAVVAFFAIGVWMPTDHSDEFAIKRGIQEENERKRATIERAQADYNRQYPWSAPLWKGSILGFAAGFTVVMIATIHGQGEELGQSQTAAAAVGYVIQVGVLIVFAICSLTKRRALVTALHKEKLERSD